MEKINNLDPAVQKDIIDGLQEIYMHPDVQTVHQGRHGKPNNEIIAALRKDISQDGRLLDPSGWSIGDGSEEVPGINDWRSFGCPVLLWETLGNFGKRLLGTSRWRYSR